MEPRRDRWKLRAKDAGLRHSQRTYAEARARALGRPYCARLAGCARAGVVVKCGCPRKREVRWYTCRSHVLCQHCRKKRSRTLRAKINAALEARLAEAPRDHQLVMMTITLAHSGDIGDDRSELMASWRRFRKAYHRRWGRFAFVATHEITPGDDGAGHAHAHVVCVWPRGVAHSGGEGDWAEVREMWLRACPRARRVSFVASRSPGRAARYIAKYVAKGVQTADFSPTLRAEVLAGTYNTRWIFTSRAAWVPFQPCCRDCGLPVIRAAYRWNGPAHPPPDRTPDWTEPIWEQQALGLLDPNHHTR